MRKFVNGKGLLGMFAALGLLGAVYTSLAQGARASAHGRKELLSFESLAMKLEANETDGDAEVNIEFKSDYPLQYFDVIAPSGRVIMRIRSHDKEKLGIQKGFIETPEPSPEEVLAAYPEGVYKFKGRTVDNEPIRGEATLSHERPAAPRITSPASAAEGVPLSGLGGTWNPVEGAAAYALELEHVETELALKVDVPATRTSFTFPPGWVLAGSEYQFGVAAIGENGNVTVTEIRFTTGK